MESTEVLLVCGMGVASVSLKIARHSESLLNDGEDEGDTCSLQVFRGALYARANARCVM